MFCLAKLVKKNNSLTTAGRMNRKSWSFLSAVNTVCPWKTLFITFSDHPYQYSLLLCPFGIQIKYSKECCIDIIRCLNNDFRSLWQQYLLKMNYTISGNQIKQNLVLHCTSLWTERPKALSHTTAYWQQVSTRNAVNNIFSKSSHKFISNRNSFIEKTCCPGT